MRYYLAGKAEEIDTYRRLQKKLDDNGHHVSLDWTKGVEERQKAGRKPTEKEMREIGMDDRQGVTDGEVLVVLPGKDLLGTLVELGIALGQNKTVFIVGSIEDFKYDSPFFHLDNVRFVTEDDLVRILNSPPNG